MKLRPLAWSVLPLALIAFACGGSTETKGELIVAVETDMSLPKDVDTIGVQVSVNGVIQFSQEYPVGAGNLKIPATIGILQGSNPSEPVQIRVLARKSGKLVVLRDALTTVPTGRLATLRMPVQWLCQGQDSDGPTASGQTAQDQAASSTCGKSMTCIEGSCVAEAIDSSTLPTYDPEQIFGGAPAPGAGGQCLDTVACFSAGYVALVDPSTCTIAKPSGGTGINVALAQGPDGTGICGPSACLIPLDDAAGDGWSDAGNGRITLPPAVCTQLASGAIDSVVVTTSCATKTPAIPTCGPWSSTSSAPGTFDAGAPDGATTPTALFSAMVTGSAGGVSITPVDGLAAIGPIATGATSVSQGLFIVLSDTAGTCPFVSSTSAFGPPSSTELAGAVLAPGSAPITIGTYPFTAGSLGGNDDAGAGPAAGGELVHYDSSCNATPTEGTNQGSITFTAITPTEVDGTLTLIYPDGTVTAQFTVPVCATANIEQIFAGPSASSSDGGAPTACYASNGSPSNDAGAGQASQIVGTAGGSVTNGDGVGVTIPPGALQTDVTITVQPDPTAPVPSTGVALSTPYLFTPEGFEFSAPITITLAFDPSQLPLGMTSADITIFTAPAGSNAYEPLATSIVDATHVSAQSTHFSDFVAVVGGISAPVDAGTCTPAPLTGFTPAVHPPTGSPGVCTAQDIANFYTACLTQGNCSGAGLSAGCLPCLFTQGSTADWGALVEFPGNSSFTNNAGCLMVSQGANGGQACGQAFEANVECETTACASCAAGSQLSACQQSAEQGECSSYQNAYDSCAGQYASTEPPSPCVSGGTEQAAFTNIATIMCGPLADAGAGGCALTCAALGVNCGPTGDGCGGTIDCGVCTAPQTCGGGGTPSVCGGNSGCVPLTMCPGGMNCGDLSDGCGGVIPCGTPCTGGQICGGGGPSICGDAGTCTPQSQAAACAGSVCGQTGDGCGGIVPCGTCIGPQTCGGGGIPGQCGQPACTPATTCPVSVQCGPYADGCGGTIASCGSCPGSETCGGTGAPYRCGGGGPSDAGAD